MYSTATRKWFNRIFNGFLNVHRLHRESFNNINNINIMIHMDAEQIPKKIYQNNQMYTVLVLWLFALKLQPIMYCIYKVVWFKAHTCLTHQHYLQTRSKMSLLVFLIVGCWFKMHHSCGTSTWTLWKTGTTLVLLWLCDILKKSYRRDLPMLLGGVMHKIEPGYQMGERVF